MFLTTCLGAERGFLKTPPDVDVGIFFEFVLKIEVMSNSSCPTYQI